MQRIKKAVKKLPTKLKRRSRERDHSSVGETTLSSSPIPDVDTLEEYSFQYIEKEPLMVNFPEIDIGAETTVDLAGDDQHTAQPIITSSLNKATIPDVTVTCKAEIETFHLEQSSCEKSNVSLKTSAESKICTCTDEELCPCQWDENNTMVHLTDLTCTQSRIWGRIQVNNVAFEKQIFVRWTHDNWESYNEQPACFEQSSTNQRKDTFTFEIEGPQVGKTVELAVRYCVQGEEYWDNNGGNNYQVLGTF